MIDLLTMPREKLRDHKQQREFHPQTLSLGRDFRFTIYEKPDPGHTYVVGSDFCQGITGADFDYAVVLDKATRPVRQVAEMVGRWGPDRFDRLLYFLARYYHNAFVVGERQFGLPVLRSLVSALGYTYVYYERDEASRGRPHHDRLGHFKGAGDPTIPTMRMAVRDRDLLLRSMHLLEQCRVFQFRPKNDKKAAEDLRDPDMKMGAPSGMYDDGVNGLSYAWKGILEIHHYADDRPKIEEGAAGDQLGMRTVLTDKPRGRGRSAFSGY